MSEKERNTPLLLAGALLLLVRNHLIVWLSLLCIIGAEVVALGLVFGTKRGRESLSE